ncbi:MAG: M28 family peptidase [Acidobacteria bacterium]|nr:M28 family peptidase [Acidobacteriota bacterium]
MTRYILVPALLAATGAAQQDAVSAARIRAHTRFLSSDLFEGRGVGTRGGRLAEEYLATQLELLGAKPGGDKRTYYQRVPLVGVATQPDSTLSAAKGGRTLNFEWQDEFVGATHTQKPEIRFEGEAVFAGHGIRAPEQPWDDFKGTDVRGKIVVVFTNEPQPANPAVFQGRGLTYYGRWTYKYEEALRQGALGAIIVHTTPTAGYGWEVVRNSWSGEDPQARLPAGQAALSFAGWMTQEAGEKLFGMAGHSVAELLKAADSPEFRPIPLGIQIQGRLHARIREVETRNVAGVIPGSDPKLAAEYVIFSAHWDHLGIARPVEGDAVYNGAVDNATGCGIVLEIARAWAALRQKPRRSALFLFWTAEESGLRGSEFYGGNPLAPPGKTAIAINYDALFPIGRTRDVVVRGAERTTAWPAVEEAARRYNLDITPDPRPEQGLYYRSDHFMLARTGVPAFSVKVGEQIHGKPPELAAELFREYNSRHYHQPSDEFREEWDFAGLEQIGRFGMLMGITVADTEKLPTWQPGDEFRAVREKALGR